MLLTTLPPRARSSICLYSLGSGGGMGDAAAVYSHPMASLSCSVICAYPVCASAQAPPVSTKSDQFAPVSAKHLLNWVGSLSTWHTALPKLKVSVWYSIPD